MRLLVLYTFVFKNCVKMIKVFSKFCTISFIFTAWCITVIFCIFMIILFLNWLNCHSCNINISVSFNYWNLNSQIYLTFFVHFESNWWNSFVDILRQIKFKIANSFSIFFKLIFVSIAFYFKFCRFWLVLLFVVFVQCVFELTISCKIALSNKFRGDVNNSVSIFSLFFYLSYVWVYVFTRVV